jgi:Phosphotyrosine interaction domain (PTB/PID)
MTGVDWKFSFKVSLFVYRICFCTADRMHEKVFAYIARNRDNETMECHAFQCSKRKIVSRTIRSNIDSTCQEKLAEALFGLFLRYLESSQIQYCLNQADKSMICYTVD